MVELQLLQTKDDGSKIYKPFQTTIKVVTEKNGSYGLVFNDRPNDGAETEWWNANSYIVKGSPDIKKVSEGDQVLVQLANAPKINKEGVATGGMWNNITALTIVTDESVAETLETSGDPVVADEVIKTPHATPTSTAKIDSFPKSLDYNVDRDNKIIMQVVLKAQIDLVNALLSANSDVSGVLASYDQVLESNITKAQDMIYEIWNKRTNISDWEILENSEN